MKHRPAVMRTLEDIPAEARIPARIVLSEESAARVWQMISQPPEPTEELKRLFDDRRDAAGPVE
jgi:uncharacterized protein (DUF1778 family)